MDDDVCTRTLLVHACHVISFLLDVINVYLGKCSQALQLMFKVLHKSCVAKIPCLILILVPFKWSFVTCVYQIAS